MKDCYCDRCGEPEDTPVIITAPKQMGNRATFLCSSCYEGFANWFDNGAPEPLPRKKDFRLEAEDEGIDNQADDDDDLEKSLAKKIDKFECPKCKGPMKLRKNRANGQFFAGCSDFPECTGTRQTDGTVRSKSTKPQEHRHNPPYVPPRSQFDDGLDDDDIPFD